MIFTARVAKEAKDAKKTLEIFSFIKVCFYYTVFKHSNTEKSRSSQRKDFLYCKSFARLSEQGHREHDVADGYKQKRALNKFYRKGRRDRKENILYCCFNKFLKLGSQRRPRGLGVDVGRKENH